MGPMLLKHVVRLRYDEEGVTLVEYGIAIILALSVGTVLLIQLANSITDQTNEAGTCMSATTVDPC